MPVAVSFVKGDVILKVVNEVALELVCRNNRCANGLLLDGGLAFLDFDNLQGFLVMTFLLWCFRMGPYPHVGRWAVSFATAIVIKRRRSCRPSCWTFVRLS